jgi:hypothetical protein
MSKPTNLISLKEFNEMQDEFNSSIKAELGSQKTESVWWSFDNLMEYFDYIKDAADDKNIDISGIRLHMIAKTKEDKNLTLAFVPTFNNDAGEHIDFDPIFSSDNNPVTLASLENDMLKVNQKGGIMNKGIIIK